MNACVTQTIQKIVVCRYDRFQQETLYYEKRSSLTKIHEIRLCYY